MQKWRYKTLVIRELALSESKMNAEGEKGWELVGVCMSDATTARAFFKMPAELYSDELHGSHHHDMHHDMHQAAVASGRE